MEFLQGDTFDDLFRIFTRTAFHLAGVSALV